MTESNVGNPLDAAIQAHQNGDLETAEARYRESLEAEGGQPLALRLLGVLLRDTGRLHEGLDYLRDAVEALPGPEGLTELALGLMAAGDYGAAELALREALEQAPESERITAVLAAVLQSRGHLTEAIETHRKVLRKHPDDVETLCNLAKAQAETGDDEGALATCAAADKAAPGHPFVLATRGAVLCDLERFKEAGDVLSQAIRRNPADDLAFFNLGYAAQATGDQAGARNAWQQALRVNPHNARATADLANLLARQGEADSALALCREFLEHYPGDRLVLASQAWVAWLAGDEQTAGQLLDLEKLVVVADLQPPPDYEGDAEFNDALADAVLADLSLLANPASKSTQGGRQTGELDLTQGVYENWATMLEASLADHARRLSLAGLESHPVMHNLSSTYSLRAWGTVLEQGGRQVPHQHPLAWYSGVYYARLPEEMLAEPDGAGCLELGVPPVRYAIPSGTPRRLIEPRVGRLVLFPSYLYHATRPFAAGEERISLAFDAVPMPPG